MVAPSLIDCCLQIYTVKSDTLSGKIKELMTSYIIVIAMPWFAVDVIIEQFCITKAYYIIEMQAKDDKSLVYLCFTSVLHSF